MAETPLAASFMPEPTDQTDQLPVRFFTICSRNYLPYARALVASLTRYMPGHEVTVVLADEAASVEAIESYVGARTLKGADLPVPTYYDMAMRYDITEFNTALKPYAFLHLFGEKPGPVVYLDPDTELHRPLTEIVQAFTDGHKGVLTPHITEPLDMDRNPTELKILRTGVYNLGFAAIDSGQDGRAFVRWWADRMPAGCRVDLDAGIFVDQKYCDLMPSYLPGTRILRHPGYNVAYWNLAHRSLQRSNGSFTVNGQPLALMHFSGIRADRDNLLSVHQDRVALDDLGEGRQLFSDYRETLRTNAEVLRDAGIETDYAYGRFRTGEAIPPLARLVYARSVPPIRRSYEAVFDLERGPFTQPAPQLQHRNRHLVSPIMADLWSRKPHLQHAFDITKPAQAEGYAIWFARTGYKEWNIPKAFVPPATLELAQGGTSLAGRSALLAVSFMEGLKRFAFLYPKPVRRAAVRWNRRVLPHIVRYLRAR
jgi:hypothetical protein